MLELPVLVERPFVQTPKVVRLVRPLEKLDEILGAPGVQAGEVPAGDGDAPAGWVCAR